PKFVSEFADWSIRRPLALALRELVPGNLIYANGHRFVPRRFHLEPVEPTRFRVDLATQAVAEIGSGRPGDGVASIGSATILSIPVCDVDLPHRSQISDDEDHRFQLAVAVYGEEQGRHGAGRAFLWRERTVDLRKSVSLRLVNVGAAQLVS